MFSVCPISLRHVGCESCSPAFILKLWKQRWIWCGKRNFEAKTIESLGGTFITEISAEPQPQVGGSTKTQASAPPHYMNNESQVVSLNNTKYVLMRQCSLKTKCSQLQEMACMYPIRYPPCHKWMRKVLRLQPFNCAIREKERNMPMDKWIINFDGWGRVHTSLPRSSWNKTLNVGRS